MLVSLFSTPSSVKLRAFSTISTVIASMPFIKASRDISLRSMSRNFCSHSPVMAGLVRESIERTFRNFMRLSARAVGTSSRRSLSTNLCAISVSIIWARVAGVPSPFSFIASASSSSSSSFPAPSIADSSVASV